MDNLFFHPKLVHLPMALAVLMPLVAGGIWLAWWRKWLPARTWLLVLGLQTILVGSALLALQTGEADEDVVERFVPESAIEAHEEAAEFFVVLSAGTWLLMAAALATSKGGLGRAIGGLAAACTLLVFAQGYRTGEAGGDLVYRHGAAEAFVSPTSAPGGLAQGGGGSGRVGGHEEDDD